MAKPGRITPHTKFKAEAYILTKEEGGRHTPFFNGYRPQFYFRTTDVTGIVELPAGTEMVMPGDNVAVTINLITPIAMDEGLRFAIREGGRTVGAGVVSCNHRIISTQAALRRLPLHLVQRKNAMRDIITLACTECKQRNYTTTKNKKNTPGKAGVQQILPLLPQAYSP